MLSLSLVTSLAKTHQPFSSGLLGTLLHLTLGIVVGLDVVLVGLLVQLKGTLSILGILNIFVGIGIIL